MPVDSDFFDRINPAQLTWYQVHYWLDEKENYELLRDVAEHNAMFWNQDGVRQIREARDNTYKTSSEDFGELVQGIFGRELTATDGRPISAKDLAEDQLNSYLNLELDEIKFTPYED